MRLGSLFFTLPTRGLTGQHVISADGRGGSFDRLVGAGEECGRKSEIEGAGCFQVNDEFELGRLTNWDLGRFRPVEDLVHNVSDASATGGRGKDR